MLCKDIGLAVNTWKTKYMEIRRHGGVIVNEHMRIGSNSYKKVKTFKYLGSLLTNQNSIQEEIKYRLKQEIHVIIQSKFSCLLFSKNSKIKIYKTKNCQLCYMVMKHGIFH